MMTREQFEEAISRYKRLIIYMNVISCVGLVAAIFLLFSAFGVVLATTDGVTMWVMIILLLSIPLMLIQIYFWSVKKLAMAHGMFCKTCGKGFLHERNKAILSNGECGYCGRRAFESFLNS